jgi:hypothetical protein
MKNLRKIIAFFAFIFIAGIFVTVITVNTSLNSSIHTEKTVDIQKNTKYLLNAEKNMQTV